MAVRMETGIGPVEIPEHLSGARQAESPEQVTELAPIAEAESEPESEPEVGNSGMTAKENELWRSARSQEQYNAVWKMRDERRLREAHATWRASEAGQLLRQLTEAYDAYRLYLEKKPHARDLAMQFDEGSQNIYKRMRANLERANHAPRCTWIKPNGLRCRAPKVRGKKLCHMHVAMDEARPKKLELPALDDANGIQIAIAKAAQAVVDGTLDRQQGGLLGYYLQLAANNVGRVDFEDEWETVDIE